MTKKNKPKAKSEYVKTNNMSVSQKIQKLGKNVVAITGGTLAQLKAHYFDGSIADLSELKDKSGNPALTEDDVSYLEEVSQVEKTIRIDTGLKETISGKGPKK